MTARPVPRWSELLKLADEANYRKALAMDLTEEHYLKAVRDADEAGFSSVESYWAVVRMVPAWVRIYQVSASRQSLYEDYALSLWSSKFSPFLPQLRTLPNGGPNALRFARTQAGIQLLDRPLTPGEEPLGKSLDFVSFREDRVIVLAHKYTDIDGGSQDNQFKDLMATLSALDSPVVSSVAGHEGKPVSFVAVGDGPYYVRYRAKGPRRMHELARKAHLARQSGASAWATRTNELGVLLARHLPLP